MILRTLSQMHCLPKVVVYGVVPRDLINSGLYCPASTPVFQYLDSCFNVGNYYPHVYDNRNNWAYSILNEHLYCWKESTKFKNLSTLWWHKLLSTFVVTKQSINVLDKQIPLLPSPEQLQQAASVCLPSKEKLREFLIERRSYLNIDMNRYSLTYNPFSSFSYKQQLSYLDEMLSLCKSAGTHFIMVNMPISRENVALLGTTLSRLFA